MNRFLVALILSIWSSSTDAIECRAEPQISNGQWWSWYTVDGRRCWYEGRPGTRPRAEMSWPAPAPPVRAEGIEPEPWIVEHRWWDGR